MICPPDHNHGANTTCYHTCGCRCDDCRTSAAKREAHRERQKAYGRYRPRVPVLGVVRRIRGLHYLGWTAAHIADLAGIDRRYVSYIARMKYVTPATFDAIDAAYRKLVAKGAGPSARTAAYARRQGWVSPLAYDDIDADAGPVRLERDRILKGEEMLDEVDHLVGMGESPDDIAKAFGKTRDNLERFAWRHHRADLASYLRERNAA
jgi:hypothetical protein